MEHNGFSSALIKGLFTSYNKIEKIRKRDVNQIFKVILFNAVFLNMLGNMMAQLARRYQHIHSFIKRSYQHLKLPFIVLYFYLL